MHKSLTVEHKNNGVNSVCICAVYNGGLKNKYDWVVTRLVQTWMTGWWWSTDLNQVCCSRETSKTCRLVASRTGFVPRCFGMSQYPTNLMRVCVCVCVYIIFILFFFQTLAASNQVWGLDVFVVTSNINSQVQKNIFFCLIVYSLYRCTMFISLMVNNRD